MSSIMCSILIIAALAMIGIIPSSWQQSCQAFVPSERMSRTIGRHRTVNHMPFETRQVLYGSSTSTMTSKEQDVEEMRADIDRMRKEAIRRLDELNHKLQQQEEDNECIAAKKVETTNGVENVSLKKDDDMRVQVLMDMADDFDKDMSHPPIGDNANKEENDVVEAAASTTSTSNQPIDSMSSSTSSVTATTTMASPPSPQISDESSTQQQHPLRLLEGTRWRMMLNIGREPGTWMTKTWGVSGDRLYLSCEVEFTDDVLYEQDDFFNGVSGTKILKVVHNEGSLAPCMVEGGRKINIKNGGWRVVPNEGPLKTTVLRFYFDVEEEVQHKGSDVYIPSGRVYFTCGYFPMSSRHLGYGEISLKEEHEKELRDLENQYTHLQMDMEHDQSILSVGQIKRVLEMMENRREADRLGKVVREERVKQPEKSLLRLSQDQSVGLTREGGVCCKQHKGVAVEYHILGKFEVSSMDNREHTDYRELLP